MRSSSTLALVTLAIPVIALACSTPAVTGSGADRAIVSDPTGDHSEESHDVRSSLLPIRLRVDSTFSFVGMQRFVLHERAEVEQHLFAVATPEGEVQRLVWIQFERLLPGVDGDYAYSRQQVVTLAGLEFDVNVRTYEKPPDTGSDRARAYAFLLSHGLRFGTPARRVRLVHIPDDDMRSEVMLVYAESSENSQATADDVLFRKALQSMTVTRRLRSTSGP